MGIASYSIGRMQHAKHHHVYPAAPSLEALDATTLIDYLDQIPRNPTYGELTHRSQLETELFTHPDLTRFDHAKYRRLRLESDEALAAHGHVIKDVSTSLGHVFVPIVLGMGRTHEERWKMTYGRAGNLLDACQENFRKNPDCALGVAAELFFNLGIKSPTVLAVPSLTREDKSYVYDGKKFCWDSHVISRGKLIPAGSYRAQVKLSDALASYHPDIVVVTANPEDEFHVARKKFIDFARLAIPDTVANNRELDKYFGRVRAMQTALRSHGPSVEKR